MPFFRGGLDVPEEITKNIEHTNKVFISINAIVPLFGGIFYFCQFGFNYSNDALPEAFAWCSVSEKLAFCLLQMVSASFLGYGIYQIKQQADED